MSFWEYISWVATAILAVAGVAVTLYIFAWAIGSGLRRGIDAPRHPTPTRRR